MLQKVGCAIIIKLGFSIDFQGGGSSCQEHISKMFNALESFYHPSNIGKWHVSKIVYQRLVDSNQ